MAKFSKKKIANYLAYYFKHLEEGICPHCLRPATGKKDIDYSRYVKPCGCLLYRGTIEDMQVVSLTEYRNAKKAYLAYKEEDPHV